MATESERETTDSPGEPLRDAEIDEATVARIERGYRRFTLVRFAVLLVTAGLVFALAVVATTIGSADIAPGEVLRALGTRLGISPGELDPETERKTLIILELRFPRVLLALLAGASLAVSGTVMQGLLRNVLVSPFTVGISAAAAFGASVAIVLGASIAGTGAIAVVSTALVAALACAGGVFSLSWFRQMRPETVILVGVALGSLFGALTSTLQMIATDEQIAAIVRWSFGSFNDASNREVIIVGVMLIIGLPWIIFKSGSLNAMAFGGDEVARGLGVNIVQMRMVCGAIAVAFAAVVISFTGIIGFVGLVAPHIARLIIGADHRYLLPFSMLCGALLLLLADTIGRNLFAPIMVPVGIVVSYVGVPIFLHLILSRRRQYF